MPITFFCACGKKLRVPDVAAGKRTRCPSCSSLQVIPASAGEENDIAVPSSQRSTSRGSRADLEDIPDALPADSEPAPRRRSYVEDEVDEVPPARKKRSRSRVRKQKPVNDSGFFALEQRWANSGIMGGLLMMAIAVVWFVGALVYADRIFFYPPVLFVVGLIAFFKGLAGE